MPPFLHKYLYYCPFLKKEQLNLGVYCSYMYMHALTGRDKQGNLPYFVIRQYIIYHIIYSHEKKVFVE